ncbi:FadR/GntR family transcriptional regulator [Pseudonocardia sichuanensis]|uniref:DNA-binding FadR family transcriptional regulator n=1 Tax=Pseudonocardia kunmingensis TaxID=630975 RepID=A0A543D4U5_9PSEU|nr:GntR family transcriptional regulator [Pseudonocardia kunmingensis]TQM04332.1 DNA-binding FadR family transcriptional regulator [Pseudonocardia kunmingensis]
MARNLIYREAQARLRDFIQEAGLGPGDRLPAEAALAQRLGVSRLSLREATRSLQTLGVIEARHGNGLFVSAFSFRPLIEQLPYGLAAPGTALEEILTAREAMEVGLMPAVARLNPVRELGECARLAEEMSALEARGESTTEVDKRFHLSLYRALGNPLVDNLIEVFWELFTRLGDAIPVPPEGGRGLVHLHIIRALQEGDAEASISAMQKHFDDIRVRAALVAGHARPSENAG